MGNYAAVGSFILGLLGVVSGFVALRVSRANALDQVAASTRTETQTLAHTELVDALNQLHELVASYRLQVDETRRALAGQEREMVELRREHSQCRDDVARLETALEDRHHQLMALEDQLRIAEARIAELGG